MSARRIRTYSRFRKIWSSNPYVFEVTKDLDLTANFEKIEDSYLIYVESPDPQMGTVTMDPANEGNIYKEGTKITVKAEPKGGYEFVQWLEVTKVDGEEVLTPVEGAGAEYEFQAEADRVLRAEFRLAPFRRNTTALWYSPMMKTWERFPWIKRTVPTKKV